MTVSRLSSVYRLRNDVFSSITPTVTVQKDISAPAGEWLPAKWLPIVFTKTNRDVGETAYVISSGKLVAFDGAGRLVPAGMRGVLADILTAVPAVGSTVLTYTSDDVEWKTEDLVTGAAVAAATTYTALEVAEALVERGFVDAVVETTSGAVPPTTITDVTEIAEAFISKAVGVAAYDIYCDLGAPERGDVKFQNFQQQHLIQFLTQLQMKVPHRTTQSTSGDTFDVSVVAETAAVTGVGDFPVAGEIWNETALDDVTRYASDVDGKSVTAWGLAQRPIAKNTERTPISCDLPAVLVNEKTSIAGIGSEGDWYLDAEAGILFTHSDTYATLVADNTDPIFSYYYYTVGVPSATGAASDHFIYFDGEGKPGDFLSYDAHSNFVVAGSSQDVLGTSNTEWVGRLLRIDSEPRGLLNLVKTAWNLTGAAASAKMPGSATDGYSDLITLTADNEEVADQLAVINLNVR